MNNFHIEFGSDIDIDANIAFINNNVNTKWLENSYLFRSARDCLKLIAKKHSNISKRVLMPILCCESMVTPFERNGYEVIFYPLLPDYTIDSSFINSIVKENDIILIENYFGFKADELIKKEDLFLNKLKKEYNTIIIKDYTQSLENALYIDKTQDDYSILSVRKWAAFPDGGIMWSKDKINFQYDKYDSAYFDLKKTAIELKSEYLKTHDANTKEQFLKAFKQADEIIDESNDILNISDYSKGILYKLDFEKILNTRKEHISYMEEALKSTNIKCLSANTNCNGQYLPIYVDNQKELQKYLAINNIYCPIIWPLSKIINEPAFDYCNDLINHMLAVPCDQRYSYEELDYIIDKIKSAN